MGPTGPGRDPTGLAKTPTRPARRPACFRGRSSTSREPVSNRPDRTRPEILTCEHFSTANRKTMRLRPLALAACLALRGHVSMGPDAHWRAPLSSPARRLLSRESIDGCGAELDHPWDRLRPPARRRGDLARGHHRRHGLRHQRLLFPRAPRRARPGARCSTSPPGSSSPMPCGTGARPAAPTTTWWPRWISSSILSNDSKVTSQNAIDPTASEAPPVSRRVGAEF